MAEHGDGIALIFARTETRTFQEWCWRRADAMLFLAGRLRFRLPGGGLAGTAGAPSVLIAYGLRNARVLQECGLAGYCVRLCNEPDSLEGQQASLFEATA
jgi:hypothetical protein